MRKMTLGANMRGSLVKKLRKEVNRKVVTELCRMDDGLPARMDGLKLTKAQHRGERLKALGNSIVPQIAYLFFEAIKSMSEKRLRKRNKK